MNFASDVTGNLFQETIILASFSLLSILCEVSQCDYAHNAACQTWQSYPTLQQFLQVWRSHCLPIALPKRQASNHFLHLLSPPSRRLGHPIKSVFSKGAPLPPVRTGQRARAHCLEGLSLRIDQSLYWYKGQPEGYGSVTTSIKTQRGSPNRRKTLE